MPITREVVSVSLPKPLTAAVRAEASKLGQSVSRLTTDLLASGLAQRGIRLPAADGKA